MNQEELDAYWAEVKVLTAPQIEFRLHYNDDGDIVLCSMSNHPESTQYIVVDRTTYDNYFRYQVVDKKLVKIDQTTRYSVQLQKSTQGFPVVKGHAGLVIEPNEEYKDIEYYDRIN